jgi:hypothetical protein
MAEGRAMAVYLVERGLPGITTEDLAVTQRAAIAASERLSADGQSVRYLRSTFLPEESRCFCLFQAPDPARVRELNEVAGLPFARIIEALELAP